MLRSSWLSFVIMLLINKNEGAKIGEISDDLAQELDIKPAKWAFAIWGIIYSLLFVVLSIAWTELNPENDGCLSTTWHIIFALTCAFNSAWIFLWTRQQVELSTVCLICLVVSLYLLWCQEISHSNSTVAVLMTNSIALYLGWCLGATVLNIGFSLINQGILNSSNQVSVICSGLICIIQITWQMMHRTNQLSLRKSVAIPIVGVWTALAICAENGANAFSIPPLLTSGLCLLHHIIAVARGEISGTDQKRNRSVALTA